jgi:asparagine synthase (glutamine-hydrolysing)
VCGIAGYLAPVGERADRAVVERMVAALHHRGPDAVGAMVNGRAGLGVARLRVIDLETGDQPVYGEDGAVSAVVNGEIYNFGELREALRYRGHRFSTRSDAEVVPHAWEEFGASAVPALTGMFALALWDRRREELVLARDRMGEKPLYYAEIDGGLVFGSELRALLAHPAVGRRLDVYGVARYLAFDYVPDHHSILEGIRKLPPGHCLHAGGDTVSVAPYWDLSFRPDERLDEAAWCEQIRQGFDRAVEMRLESDVPLGCFVSGGIDSTAVAATAARQRPGIRTFSVGYTGTRHDERGWARLVADRCGTTHEELEVGPEAAGQVIRALGDLLDEPVADMSFVPLYLLARAARRHITVALTGDGGDEVFAGYPTMAAERWHRRFAALPPLLVALLARSGRARGVPEPLGQFLAALGERPDARNQVLLGGMVPGRYRELLTPAVQAALAGFDPYDDIARTLAPCRSDEPTARLVYRYFKLYLAGQNLVNADRASMAVALELRAPFLDHQLVELLSRVPSRFKLSGFANLKRLLKRALADRLPVEILRRGKQGFGVPLSGWFRGPLAGLVREVLAPDRLRAGGIFAPPTVGRLVEEHLAGRRDHGRVLWALVVFECWRDAYLGGRPSLSPAPG